MFFTTHRSCVTKCETFPAAAPDNSSSRLAQRFHTLNYDTAAAASLSTFNEFFILLRRIRRSVMWRILRNKNIQEREITDVRLSVDNTTTRDVCCGFFFTVGVRATVTKGKRLCGWNLLKTPTLQATGVLHFGSLCASLITLAKQT